GVWWGKSTSTRTTFFFAQLVNCGVLKTSFWRILQNPHQSEPVKSRSRYFFSVLAVSTAWAYLSVQPAGGAAWMGAERAERRSAAERSDFVFMGSWVKAGTLDSLAIHCTYFSAIGMACVFRLGQSPATKRSFPGSWHSKTLSFGTRRNAWN